MAKVTVKSFSMIIPSSPLVTEGKPAFFPSPSLSLTLPLPLPSQATSPTVEFDIGFTVLNFNECVISE